MQAWTYHHHIDSELVITKHILYIKGLSGLDPDSIHIDFTP